MPKTKPPACDRLIEAIARVAPAARTMGTAASVHEAHAWLARHDPPDLMLQDIQLADIERDLDPRSVFRVNRQYLVNAAAIVRIAAAGRGRLDLQLSPHAEGEVRVSQERAGAFRARVRR